MWLAMVYDPYFQKHVFCTGFRPTVQQTCFESFLCLDSVQIVKNMCFDMVFGVKISDSAVQKPVVLHGCVQKPLSAQVFVLQNSSHVNCGSSTAGILSDPSLLLLFPC